MLWSTVWRIAAATACASFSCVLIAALLPSKIFSKSLANAKADPARLTKTLRSLFEAMAHGGMFGADEILYFNGSNRSPTLTCSRLRPMK